jgi:hypothetical protein
VAKKLKGRALAQFEAKRDIWQEVLDGVRKIQSGRGKRRSVEPRSPIVRARLKAGLTQDSSPRCSEYRDARWSNGSKDAGNRAEQPRP